MTWWFFLVELGTFIWMDRTVSIFFHFLFFWSGFQPESWLPGTNCGWNHVDSLAPTAQSHQGPNWATGHWRSGWGSLIFRDAMPGALKRNGKSAEKVSQEVFLVFNLSLMWVKTQRHLKDPGELNCTIVEILVAHPFFCATPPVHQRMADHTTSPWVFFFQALENEVGWTRLGTCSSFSGPGNLVWWCFVLVLFGIFWVET